MVQNPTPDNAPQADEARGNASDPQNTGENAAASEDTGENAATPKNSDAGASTDAPSKDTSQAAPKLPWMDWKVGERVVVRYRKPDGFYDALGHLTEVAPDHVTVNTRKGLVTVPANVMVTGKRVPESPFGY